MPVVVLLRFKRYLREKSDYLLILPTKVLNNKIKVHSSCSWCPHWLHFTNIET